MIYGIKPYPKDDVLRNKENKDSIVAVLFGGFDSSSRYKCSTYLFELCSKIDHSAVRELIVADPYVNDEYSSDYVDLKDSIQYDKKWMEEANIVSFYFSKGRSNSISFFELGYLFGNKELLKDKNVIISFEEGFNEDKMNIIMEYITSLDFMNPSLDMGNINVVEGLTILKNSNPYEHAKQIFRVYANLIKYCIDGIIVDDTN